MHSPLNDRHFRPSPAASPDGLAGWLDNSAETLPLRRCRNPRVVPAHIQQCSVMFDPFEALSAGSWTVKASLYGLMEATPLRQFEFLAGRACVAVAMRALGIPDQPLLRRQANGTPAWSAGLTGSITHTKGFVSAALASTREVAAIGIDSEEILSADRARRVMDVFATPGEIAVARAAGLDHETAVTLIFSAKEAIFKGLHWRVRRVFDFHDVQITAVNDERGRFIATIAQALSTAFPVGSTLDGHFDIDSRRVHTGMLLVPRVRE